MRKILTDIKKRVTGKLSDRSGLTLVELLCAIAVMLLATGLMVTAIQMGTHAFTKSTKQSEAQVLCGTLSTAVQDEIRFASDIKNISSDSITYCSRSRGKGKDCVLTVVNDHIMLQVQENDGTSQTYPIVSSSDYVFDLKAGIEISGTPEHLDFTVNVMSGDGTVLSSEQFAVESVNT